MKLLIVESPGKVKKVQSFLGPDWKVMASVGHVRDLPTKEMGVAPPDFRPAYVATARGKEVLARLKAASKSAEAVYLATDPDREGEAIAWHLEDALKLKNPKRITFTEITEKAVLAALKHPRRVDMALVAAQEGRRVLDRLVGYLVSPALSRVNGGKLSAGRVQSPALRRVVEREREIQNFRLTEHYGAELAFSEGWKAIWMTKSWLEPGQEYCLNKSLAARVAQQRKLTVLDCQETESRVAPPAPFTTSSLQQAASNALKFAPKLTMQLAQRLYEAGHITYMRTDSPNLSQDAIDEIRVYCVSKGWSTPAKPRTWKSKAGAQEAHEAIRPTHIEVEEAGETDDEKALYRLIRLRTLASQLEDALYAVRIVQLQGEQIGAKDVLFEAKGRTMLSPGWKQVMENDQSGDGQDAAAPDAKNPVPQLKPGASLIAASGRLLSKKTTPPVRYTEATLIQELERLGIGRPSTYAAILDNIMSREYVSIEKRFLVPTHTGETIIDALNTRFSFVNYDFTKRLEEELDHIAEGKAVYLDVMQRAHSQLEKELKSFAAATGHTCSECGQPLRHMIKKPGKDGTGGYNFWGCSAYPKCKATVKDNDGKPAW